MAANDFIYEQVFLFLGHMAIYTPDPTPKQHAKEIEKAMLTLWLEPELATTSYFPITLITFFLALSLLIKWSCHCSNKKKLHLPPSPPTFQIIGNLHQLGLYPHRSLQNLARIHGPIMLIRLGSTPALIISSADVAREIMRTHDIIFSNRPKARLFEILIYDQKDIAGAPYGEYWRQMKSICVVHLLSNKRVQSYRHVREQETNLMIDQIRNKSTCSCSSQVIDLTEMFVKLTKDIVCRVALGRKYYNEDVAEGKSRKGRSFKELLMEAGNLMGAFDVGEFIPWLRWVSSAKGLYSKAKKIAKELDEFFEMVVDEHVANSDGMKGESKNKDFIDVLLWIQKENLAGFPIDRTCIKAIIQDVFGAGTNTTYTLLEWAMTELLRHPNAMKKLQSEIRETTKNISELKEDDINKIPYLKAVIKETLRLHPPSPLLVPRVSTQETKIKGFDISRGTRVVINYYAIGRDPTLWDRADEFWPERFLNSSLDFKGQHFELIPFGSGRRMCPGVQFVISTVEVALAKLLGEFDWELQEGVELDMTETFGNTVRRKLPLFGIATPYC